MGTDPRYAPVDGEKHSTTDAFLGFLMAPFFVGGEEVEGEGRGTEKEGEIEKTPAMERYDKARYIT